jgi:hypothetical protein
VLFDTDRRSHTALKIDTLGTQEKRFCASHAHRQLDRTYCAVTSTQRKRRKAPIRHSGASRRATIRYRHTPSSSQTNTPHDHSTQSTQILIVDRHVRHSTPNTNSNRRPKSRTQHTHHTNSKRRPNTNSELIQTDTLKRQHLHRAVDRAAARPATLACWAHGACRVCTRSRQAAVLVGCLHLCG